MAMVLRVALQGIGNIFCRKPIIASDRQTGLGVGDNGDWILSQPSLRLLRNRSTNLPVVLRRVDADAWLIDDADGDRVAGFEDAKLFELLGGFEGRAGQGTDCQQELAAVGVKAQVEVGDGGA